MVNSQFVTDSELDTFINGSYREWRDLLCASYGDDYFSSSHSFTTNGTSDTYALPDDFLKLLGVDLLVGSEYVTLRPFNFNERNRYGGQSVAIGNSTNLRYRLNANNLWLAPRATSGQTVRLWYVPRVTALSSSSDGAMNTDGSGTITLSGVVAGDAVTVTATASNGAISTITLTAGTDFAVGASDSQTAASLVNAIHASSILDLGLTAYQSMSDGTHVIILSAESLGYTFAWTASAHMTFDGGSSAYLDGVQGWEEYVVVDAAIKCKEKEESDASVLAAQKAELRARIVAASKNRDASEPAKVVDRTAANEWWG